MNSYLNLKFFGKSEVLKCANEKGQGALGVRSRQTKCDCQSRAPGWESGPRGSSSQLPWAQPSPHFSCVPSAAHLSQLANSGFLLRWCRSCKISNQGGTWGKCFLLPAATKPLPTLPKGTTMMEIQEWRPRALSVNFWIYSLALPTFSKQFQRWVSWS